MKALLTGILSIAVVALRTPKLRPVQVDGAHVALRLLADRRDELGARRTQTINRLHRLLADLIDGGAKRFLSAAQAKTLLAGVRPLEGRRARLSSHRPATRRRRRSRTARRPSCS